MMDPTDKDRCTARVKWKYLLSLSGFGASYGQRQGILRTAAALVITSIEDKPWLQ